MSWHSYKILAHTQKIEQIKAGLMPAPIMAAVSFNYTCNQKCKSCAFLGWNNDGYTTKKEVAFKIIDDLMNYGVEGFDICGGGEPTLLPYLEDLIHYILDRGGNYGLITNGMSMSPSLIHLVAQTATYVRVSLETGDPVLYQEYKGVSREVFDKVIENIQALMSAKVSETEISLKYDVDKNLKGFAHINNSFLLARRLNVDTAIFKGMTGGTESAESEKRSASEQLDLLARQFPSKVTVVNSILYEKVVPQCWLNPLHTVVDAFGDVYLCCYYYRPDAHTKDTHCIGNMIERPFADIWESDEHRKKINAINSKNCAKFDCKFFGHHKIVREVLTRGKVSII